MSYRCFYSHPVYNNMQNHFVRGGERGYTSSGIIKRIYVCISVFNLTFS